MSSQEQRPLRSPSPQGDHVKYVIKRNGEREPMNPDKICARLLKLKNNAVQYYRGRRLPSRLDISITSVANACIDQLYDGISTSEIDEAAAAMFGQMTDHCDYALFGGILLADNLMSNLRDTETFVDYIDKAWNHHDEVTGKHQPLVSYDLHAAVMKFEDFIREYPIDYRRNYLFDYMAMCTLIRSRYLISTYVTRTKNGVTRRQMVPIEHPQYMYLRIALGIYADKPVVTEEDIRDAFSLYEVLSTHQATMATPTMFHAGTPNPTLVSCFLLGMEDSIEGIYKCLADCAQISKGAGGLAVSVHDIRSTGSYIAGTNGTSNGIVPMLRVFERTADYVDQGGGKRKGSFAMYLEPHHPDIMDFLEMKLPDGHEEQRARGLFYAMWISDLFMERLQQAVRDKESDQTVMWSLFDPSECPGLSDCYGDDYRKLYTEYEEAKRYRKQVPVEDVARAIFRAQIMSGTPYILFKDSCNRKSNHRCLGTIKCSNLCSEIIEYSTPEEPACCNLASVSLPAFVDYSCPERTFDFKKLAKVVKRMVVTLDRVIDYTAYPTNGAYRSNVKHRPIGLGIQGWADTCAMLGYPFESDEARQLNIRIAQVMYYFALESSMELAKRGQPYPSFFHEGCPIRQGILQYHMWGLEHPDTSDWFPEMDWEKLVSDIQHNGVANSLLRANMPTASTSIILGNNESIEPYSALVVTKKTKSGQFTRIVPEMVRRLYKIGVWKTVVDPATGHKHNPVLEYIREHNGSIQGAPDVPLDIQRIFKTAYEIPISRQIDLSADRGAYVCQSESFNIFLKNEKDMMEKLLKTMIRGWKRGLKTGSYYARTLQTGRKLNYATTFTRSQDDPRAATTTTTTTTAKNKNSTTTIRVTVDARPKEGVTCSRYGTPFESCTG